jgi:flagellar M-ring protein FliF
VSERGQFPNAGRLWQSATPSQRLGVAAFALICIGLLALAAAIGRRPHFAVLYANLQQEDAAEVVKRLRDLKAPYQVTGSGTIEAPADQIDELRLDLAANGLPTGGQTGFELFDKTRVGLSEFGEQLNYQRALQGELARTISHLDSVEQARVHVAIPRERLYESEQEKPTASVVLKLRGDGKLTPAQVASVVHLVSGAVGGLAPEAVTVLDTRGRLLSSAEDATSGGMGMSAASNQFQMQREYERQIEQAVQSMLDGVIGAGKSMVRASASLDPERVESERETYQPAPDGNGVVQSRHETKETYHGLGEPGAVGIPGVSSNSAAGVSGLQSRNSVAGAVSGLRPTAPLKSQNTAAGATDADQYEHSETSAEYRVSRQVERTLRPPGQLKRLSVAVFVDEKAKTGKPDELRSAVAAAAGLDPKRGDTVVISQTPFEPPAADEKGSKVFAVRDFYFTVGRDFAAIVLAALFLKFVGGMIRRRTPAGSPEGAPGRGPSAEASRRHAPQEAIASAPAPEPVPASFDPDRAVAVLRGWLNSDPDRREEAAASAAAAKQRRSLSGTGTTPRGGA